MKKTRMCMVSAGSGLAAVLALGALVAAGALSPDVQAQGIELKVEVGDAMPAFTMKDTAGKEHSLSDFKGKVVVIDFASMKCPYSRGVDPDVQALHEENKDKDVVVLAIDSHYETTPEEIAAYMEEHGYKFPVLKDEGNAYADEVGATRTPEMFVLDKEGKVAYYGAFDDRKSPEAEPETEYVADAVAALLAGEEVTPKKVSPWGCTIKRAK